MNGIVEPLRSEKLVQVVLVPKKDGTKRFCVDYRMINKVTVSDNYPPPHINDLLDYLGKVQLHNNTDEFDEGILAGACCPYRPKIAFITTFGS